MSYHGAWLQQPYNLKIGKKYDYHWLFSDHSWFNSEFDMCCPEFRENAWWCSAEEEDSATEFFVSEPTQEQLALVRTVMFPNYYPAADVEELEGSWHALQQSGAIGYRFEQLLIVKELAYFERFLASDFVKALPNLHIQKTKDTLRSWISAEATDENCAQPDCQYKRVKYGANCGRHHFEMLMKEPFPEYYLLE